MPNDTYYVSYPLRIAAIQAVNLTAQRRPEEAAARLRLQVRVYPAIPGRNRGVKPLLPGKRPAQNRP